LAVNQPKKKKSRDSSRRGSDASRASIVASSTHSDELKERAEHEVYEDHLLHVEERGHVHMADKHHTAPAESLYVDERDDVFIATQEELDEEEYEERAMHDMNDRHQYMEKEGETAAYYEKGRDNYSYEDDANKTTGFEGQSMHFNAQVKDYDRSTAVAGIEAAGEDWFAGADEAMAAVTMLRRELHARSISVEHFWIMVSTNPIALQRTVNPNPNPRSTRIGMIL